MLQTEQEQVRDFLRRYDFRVAGGIATVPGRDFGVCGNSSLKWFNWQNEKPQRDLEGVMRTAAQVFDEFIIDDVSCTADTSQESDAARQGRSWSDYRRDLLAALSTKVFIGPARRSEGRGSTMATVTPWTSSSKRGRRYSSAAVRCLSRMDLDWKPSSRRVKRPCYWRHWSMEGRFLS